jgi:hypothetical protein
VLVFALSRLAGVTLRPLGFVLINKPFTYLWLDMDEDPSLSTFEGSDIQEQLGAGIVHYD